MAALRTLLCLSGLVAVSACKTASIPEVTSANQFEAGSTFIAVTGVAPWSAYSEALQPKFGLTAPQALEKVLQASSHFDRQIESLIQVNAALALPQLTTSGSSTLTKSRNVTQTGNAAPVIDQQQTSNSTETTSKAPGAVPDLPDDPALAAPGTLPSLRSGVASAAQDPRLQYEMATALYQQVKDLEEHLKHVPRRNGYEPYLVRLQISTQPHKRNQPYDVYSDISLFQHKESPLGTPIPSPNLPVVIPLVGGETIESSVESVSLVNKQLLGAALAGTISNIGLSAEAKNAYSDLQKGLANDLNSLFLVSQNGENGLRVRLGARRVANDAYEMVPRQHTVLVLVLFKTTEEVAKVTVHASHRYRNAKTGEILPAGEGNTNARHASILREIYAEYLEKKTDDGKYKSKLNLPCDINNSPRSDKTSAMAGIRERVLNGKYKEYIEDLENCTPSETLDPEDFYGLWSNLQGLIGDYQSAPIRFDIPPNRDRQLEAAIKQPQAISAGTLATKWDGEKLVAALPRLSLNADKNGLHKIEPGNLAYLTFPGDELAVIPASIEGNADAGFFRATFASVKGRLESVKAKSEPQLAAFIAGSSIKVLIPNAAQPLQNDILSFKIDAPTEEAKPAPAKETIALRAMSPNVLFTPGQTADVKIYVSSDSPTSRLAIIESKDAEIAGGIVLGSWKEKSGALQQTYTVPTNQWTTLSLRQLRDGQSFTLSVITEEKVEGKTETTKKVASEAKFTAFALPVPEKK